MALEGASRVVLNASADRLALLDDRMGDIDLDKLPAVVSCARLGAARNYGRSSCVRKRSELLQSAKLNVKQRQRRRCSPGKVPRVV
jgi:hypothetical protein